MTPASTEDASGWRMYTIVETLAVNVNSAEFIPSCLVVLERDSEKDVGLEIVQGSMVSSSSSKPPLTMNVGMAGTPTVVVVVSVAVVVVLLNTKA